MPQANTLCISLFCPALCKDTDRMARNESTVPDSVGTDITIGMLRKEQYKEAIPAPNALHVAEANHFQGKNSHVSWFNILAFYRKDRHNEQTGMEIMNLRYNLIVIFHISQGTVWMHCVISQIKWSHCINNTSSIQNSKCVNRGESLAHSGILPTGRQLCSMCDTCSSLPLKRWSKQSAWDYCPHIDRNLVSGCYTADNAES